MDLLINPLSVFAESPQSSKLKSENVSRLSADISRMDFAGAAGGLGASASLSDTNSCDTSADDNVERLRKELKMAREQILRKCNYSDSNRIVIRTSTWHRESGPEIFTHSQGRVMGIWQPLKYILHININLIF